jgi:uncharacterized spore protein YtfJ
MSESIKLPGMETIISVGKEIIAGDRTILPLMEIFALKIHEDKIVAVQITPLAMLIIEPAGQYAASFDGQPMTVEAVLEMAPDLRDALEKAEELHRAKVD